MNTYRKQREGAILRLSPSQSVVSREARSPIPRRGHKPAHLSCQELREHDRRRVFPERSHDLQTDRQFAASRSERSNRSRTTGQRRRCDPAHQIHVLPWTLRRGNRALAQRRSVVVSKCRGKRHRRKEYIDIFKIRLPLGPISQALEVLLLPIREAREARNFLPARSRFPSGLLHFVRLLGKKKGIQMEHVGLVQLFNLEFSRPAWFQLRARSFQAQHRPLHHGLDLCRHRAIRIVQHVAHAKLAQAFVPRRGHLPLPGFRRVVRRTAKEAHRCQQILRAARQRSAHGQKRRGPCYVPPPAGRVSQQTNEIERRLMPENSAEMRRYANRSADIAADAQIPQPRGQRRSSSARRSPWSPLYIPRIVRRPVNLVVALPVTQSDRNIGRPISTAPAPRKRATASEFAAALESFSSGIPQVHGCPATA